MQRYLSAYPPFGVGCAMLLLGKLCDPARATFAKSCAIPACRRTCPPNGSQEQSGRLSKSLAVALNQSVLFPISTHIKPGFLQLIPNFTPLIKLPR